MAQNGRAPLGMLALLELLQLYPGQVQPRDYQALAPHVKESYQSHQQLDGLFSVVPARHRRRLGTPSMLQVRARQPLIHETGFVEHSQRDCGCVYAPSLW